MENYAKNEIKLNCAAKISAIVSKPEVTNFKIGKTTQQVDDRYRQGYEKEYDEIHLVYSSSDGALIDWLEKQLISEFMETYGVRCDNNQIGGGPNCADNKDDQSYLYLVTKHNKD